MKENYSSVKRLIADYGDKLIGIHLIGMNVKDFALSNIRSKCVGINGSTSITVEYEFKNKDELDT